MNTVTDYTSVEVTELTGVSYRQLDYWLRHGVVSTTWACDRCGTDGDTFIREIRVELVAGSPRTMADADTILHLCGLCPTQFRTWLEESK